MNRLTHMQEHLNNCVYASVKIFHFTVFVFGTESTVKAIMFDSWVDGMYCNEFIKQTSPGTAAAVDTAVKYLQCYEKKIYAPIPPCDLGLYTEKEQKVLTMLTSINPGSTVSYSRLAQQCGFINAGRFVGNVMAKNLFPVAYPCHRVIKQSGNPGGYGGGASIKKFLLDFEAELTY